MNPILTNGYVNFDVTKCFYEIHTHDATGVIHLHANAGANRPLTLGQVFDVWGQPLTRDNVAGQLVRRFEGSTADPEFVELEWDGKTNRGEPATPGVYLYRLESGVHSATRKMILLK